MKHRILLFLLSIISITCFAQTNPSFRTVTFLNPSGFDSTLITTNGTMWYNHTTNKFRFRQNGQMVSLGSGSGSGGWPLTGTAALTGNTSITGDFGLNLGTATNHLDSFSVYTETRMLLHAQDQFAVDVHDDITSDIVTIDVQPKSINVQLGDAAQTLFQLNDEDGGNGVTVTTTGNDISLTATGAGDINLTGGIVADVVTVSDDAYGAGWNGSTQVPTKNAVYDQVELKGALANTSSAITDASTMDITGPKHTLTTSSATRTFTQSWTGDFTSIVVTLNATSSTFTFPAGALCVSEGAPSGNNTLPLAGLSGDKYYISISKYGTDYYVVAKNFGQ